MSPAPIPGSRASIRLVAAALGLAAFLAVAFTIDDPGVTWDEPGYLDAARLEISWLSQLPARTFAGSLATWASPDTLEAYWHFRPYSNPHPPFYKILAGSTWAAFRDRLGDYPAFRLASAALFGVLIATVFLWGSVAGGSGVVGVGAALALLFMPRVVGDAHVAATDMPLTVFWCLAAWFFWRAARQGREADVVAFGLFWGMALATKFTGFLLPVPLLLWGLLHERRHLAPALIVGGCVALALRVLLDPYLWPDPLGRLIAFVEQSTTRQAWAPISTFYLGRTYPFVLPWHQSIVMTLVTLPLPILVLAGAGALRLRAPAARPLVSLCLIEIGFYQLLMALPSSPNHDGVRLFLPQFPFVALLAGLGFGRLWDVVGARARAAGAAWRPAAARAALCALVFFPPAAELVAAHPFELDYYGEAIGGARGAFARGFESTYWWDAATPGFLATLDRELPPGARVWVSVAPYHFTSLQAAGLVRGDLSFTDSLPSPYLILQTRQGVFGEFEWRLLRSVRPMSVIRYQGVPLLSLYRWQ
jgi:hypothetical protein